jgi:hypothetical protein
MVTESTSIIPVRKAPISTIVLSWWLIIRLRRSNPSIISTFFENDGMVDRMQIFLIESVNV